MSILIPVPVPHTQTTLDIEGVRYLLMDPEVLRKAISAHPSISTERVTAPSRDDLAEIISKAGAPPGPPDGPIGALPVTHFLRVQAYKQADAVLAALTEAE